MKLLKKVSYLTRLAWYYLTTPRWLRREIEDFDALCTFVLSRGPYTASGGRGMATASGSRGMATWHGPARGMATWCPPAQRDRP
jgi:hypothetical protein